MSRPTPTYLDRERTVPEALRWAKEQADPRRAALDWFVESLSQAHNLSGESQLKFRSFYAYLFSRAFDMTEEEAKWECDRELGIQAKSASPYPDAATVMSLGETCGWSRSRRLLELNLLVHPRKGVNAAALEGFIDLCFTGEGSLIPYGQVSLLLRQRFEELCREVTPNTVYTVKKALNSVVGLLYEDESRLNPIPSDIRVGSHRPGSEDEVDYYVRHLLWRSRNLLGSSSPRVAKPDDRVPSWQNGEKKDTISEALDRVLDRLAEGEAIHYLIHLNPDSTSESALSIVVNRRLSGLVGVENGPRLKVYKDLYLWLREERGFEGGDFPEMVRNLLERTYILVDKDYLRVAQFVHLTDAAQTEEEFLDVAGTLLDEMNSGGAKLTLQRAANCLFRERFGGEAGFSGASSRTTRESTVGRVSVYNAGSVPDWEMMRGFSDRISKAVGKVREAEEYALSLSTDDDGSLRCHYCSVLLPLGPDGARTVYYDHGVATSVGGLAIPGNLYATCQRCNGEKGSEGQAAYAKWRWKTGQSLNRDFQDYERFETEAKEAHEALFPGWSTAYDNPETMASFIAGWYVKCLNGYWS